MTETLVAPLLPKIGQRARFMAKLDLLKNEVSNDVLSLSSNGSIRSLRKQEFESFCLLCFICQKLFCGWHSLSVHFKVYHSLMPSSNYICGQGGCQRDFQSLKGLRRHIFSEHSKLLSNNSRAHSVADSTGSCDAKLHTVEDEFSGNDVSQSPDIVETRSFFDENGVCLAAARFIAKLKSHSSIPASTVDQIVEDVQEFFSSDLIHLLHCKTKHLLETFNIDMNDSMVLSLLDDFSHLGDLFTGLKSQHQQLKFFQNSGCYIAPEAITVGHRFENRTVNKTSVLVPVNATAQHIPLRKTFMSFFGLPEMFEKAKVYMNKEQNVPVMKDFVDGDLWKSRGFQQAENRLIVPFVLYFDDFETANPLGSRAGVYKLGAIYACLKCFPPRFNSQLKNLFLTLLFFSEDRSLYGSESVLRTLVEEIKYLQQHGIQINIAGQNCEIKFILVQILGDNLGLNSILGYTESFSANHFCRACRVSKHTTAEMLFEDKHFLRNTVNYAADLVTNNVSHTGVKTNAIWNEIPGFHVTMNSVFDIMHDLLEGVCAYDMRHIIHYVVNERKFMNFDVLNARIQGFEYGLDDASNKPPVIVTFAQPSDHQLNMKAIEMLQLVKYFSLMVGDLVPEGDEVWSFYLILCQIMDLLFAHSISAEELVLLRTLVAEHHELYVKHFNDTLKPKHHFMVHYATAMQSLGPLCWLSSLRFESKHGEAKRTAHMICNFRNISKSLAHKHQLKFCYRIFSNDSLSEYDLVVGTGNMVVSDTIDGDETEISLSQFGIKCPLFNAKWITLNGTTYRPGQTLLIGVMNDMPLFGELICVFVDNDRIVHFIVNELDTICYVEHFNVYEVEKTCKQKYITPQDLLDHRSLQCRRLPSRKEFQHVVKLHAAL